MKSQKGAGVIAGIFLLGLIVELSLYWKLSSGAFARIWPEEAQSLLELILALYAVPFGVICGGSLSTRSKVTVLSQGKIIFFVAVVVIWNVLVTLPELNMVTHPGAKIATCLTDMRGTADKAGFLITGILGFFFGSSDSNATVDPASK